MSGSNCAGDGDTKNRGSNIRQPLMAASEARDEDFRGPKDGNYV